MTVDTESLRAALGSCTAAARDLLVDLIAVPSTYGRAAQAQELVAEAWRSLGLELESRPIPDSLKDDPEYSWPQEDLSFEGRQNVLARLGGGKGRSLIVNAHADVVPAVDWPGAFQPVVDGDTVYGRGACDDKGCLAAMYLAAAALRELGLAPDGEVIFQSVIDEEVGGNGSLALVRDGVRADGVLVLEPTGLAVHPANRGAVWFRFEFEGKPCHMGRKHDGVSAVDLAAETIGILYEYEKELIRDAETQPLFAGYDFPTQVNVGILNGGEWPSMVPAKAVMEGGVGFLPNRPMERVKEDVVRYIDERGSEQLRGRYSLSFPKLHNDSYETPVDHPFVRACADAARDAGLTGEITGWNVSCDARLFAKLGDMPTVVFGPGRIEDAHSAGECVSVTDIAKAAEMIVRTIERWCGLGART